MEDRQRRLTRENVRGVSCADDADGDGWGRMAEMASEHVNSGGWTGVTFRAGPTKESNARKTREVCCADAERTVMDGVGWGRMAEVAEAAREQAKNDGRRTGNAPCGADEEV